MQTKVYPKIEEVPEGVILPKQVHGEKIVELVDGSEDLSDCDAMITSNKDLVLGIRTADCAPVCFSDGDKIGIAHIGWPGLCLPLTEKMMTHFNPKNLEVFVGPFMHSFEIKRDSCYDRLFTKFGDKFMSFEEERIIFHFKDALTSILPQNTKFDYRNTYQDTTLPSYRRDKTTDRVIASVSF